MTVGLQTELQRSLDTLDRGRPEATPQLLDALLRDAIQRGASDIHLEPTHRALEVRFRLDGVLHLAATLRRELAPNLIARLKVLAELLTYRTDVPQEGRLHWDGTPAGSAMRVSTFPTIHGEKAAIRLFDSAGRALDLDQVGLPPGVRQGLDLLLEERSGAVLLTGPSGSGKTTTIYACLRQLVRSGQGSRHIVTLEDPVEQIIEGVTQAQARPGSEFDFARGMRSLLRQDPEVLMIGEIRDPETAGIAIEAALTGHLVFSTLHAGSACGVLGRLLDMGIEPYLLTSGVRGILNQRLVRRCCPGCSRPGSVDPPPGCAKCSGTGYSGRLLLAELLTIHPALRRVILAKGDVFALEATAAEIPHPTLAQAAADAVKRGATTWQEIHRVLGSSGP